MYRLHAAFVSAANVVRCIQYSLSFDVLPRKLSRKHEKLVYNVHSFHLLGDLGRALNLAGLKRPGLKIIHRKWAGPGL